MLLQQLATTKKFGPTTKYPVAKGAKPLYFCTLNSVSNYSSFSPAYGKSPRCGRKRGWFLRQSLENNDPVLIQSDREVRGTLCSRLRAHGYENEQRSQLY